MTSDLTGFITARLDEDERVARNAERHPPGQNDSGTWHHVALQTPWDTRVDEHIARHDPARVLLQVTAIQAILAHRQRLVDAGDTDAGGHPLRLDQLRERQAVLRHLGAVLEMLAVFWADHPDYRDEWSP